MNEEIKVRKPRVINFFGELYTNRWRKWEKSMPKNGDKIKITWLPSCKNVPNGTPNPYVGMEGIVEELNIDGDFFLNCGTCQLVVSGAKFNYIHSI